MDWFPLRLALSRDSTTQKRPRIKRSCRWDDEGVASTVGTIMSLMVFLTAMGMFTNQFVPVWMSDNESAHMSDAIGEFVTLKSQIDGVIVDYANELLAPAPIFVPITLSAEGIPVFAASTAGILKYSPASLSDYPWFNITYASDEYTVSPATDGSAGGYLELYCPNRYYVEQWLVYEAGAVILNQSNGEFIIAGPQFAVSNFVSGSTVARVVKITQLDMLGINRTIGGMGSKGVNADVLYASTTAYNSSAGTDLTFSIVTQHGTAWENYFKKQLNSSMADLIYGVDFTVTKVKTTVGGWMTDYYTVTVTISEVNVLDHSRATVQMSIGELGGA